MRITLALCTYNRPKMLDRCLKSIAIMTVPSGIEFSVLVVDNNDNQSNQGVVASFKKSLKINYAICDKVGLVYARNKVLSILKQDSPDYIGFIDDDEVVSLGWLTDMLYQIKSLAADIIAGPIQTKSDYPMDKALLAAYQFKGVSKARQVQQVPMGNIFFSRKILVHDLWFDKRFNHIGGEDIDFMRRATKQRIIIMRVPSGLVTEYLTKQKVTYGAYYQRQFRVAQTHYSMKYPKIGFLYIFECLGTPFEVIFGLILMLISPFKKILRVKSIKILAKALGKMFFRFPTKSVYGT